MSRKAQQSEPKAFAIRMMCILSGDGWSASPGEVIEVDEAEATRLVELGVAERVDETETEA